MPDVAHLYPPAPAAVPPDLTAPSRSYRARVVIVLLCLAVFVAVYLGLMAGSAYLSYVSEEFQGALAALRQAYEAMRDQLTAARGLLFPALTNVTAGDPLGPFLLTRPLVKNLRGHESSLDGQWIHEFMSQVDEIQDRAARVRFKSLGGLLAFQDQLAERWAAGPTVPAEA